MAERARVSRREFLRWAGLGAAGAALAACAPREAVTTKEVVVEHTVEVPVLQTVVVTEPVAGNETVGVTATVEPIVLSLWWCSWDDELNAEIANIGARYAQYSPSVMVEASFDPDYPDKLVTAIAAGTPPDVAYLSQDHNIDLASQGALLPLDAYLVVSDLRRDHFLIPMYDASVWDGKLYSLPGGADLVAMYWNRGLYVDAGLDPESPPVTTDDLVEQSVQLLEVDDAGEIARLGWMPNTRGNPLWRWALLFGGQWYDASNEAITATDPVNVETLSWMKSYVDRLGADRLELFVEAERVSQGSDVPFASGNTALWFDSYEAHALLDTRAPDIDYGVARFPTPTGTQEELRRYSVRGWVVAIPVEAPRPNAAWDFIRYAFVDNAWKTACDTLSGNSVIAQMGEFEDCVAGRLGPANRVAPYLHVFSEAGLAAGEHWPAIPVNALYARELNRAYDAVVRDEKTASAALADVEATVQEELDRVLQGEP